MFFLSSRGFNMSSILLIITNLTLLNDYYNQQEEQYMSFFSIFAQNQSL